MNNQYKSNIINGSQSALGMMNGVKQVVDLVRPTYGGAGTNVIVESKLYPYSMVANDAQTIVQAIHLTDHLEKRGVGYCKELCDRSDKMSGDARKTTLLLMDEILRRGYEAEIPKLQLKRELDALIPIIEKEIDNQTTQITVDQVASVATTASENPETGLLLQEIYQKIGKDGIIHLEASGTYDTAYTFIEGVRFFDTGYLSPSMVHDEQAIKDKVKETKAVYEKPLILVTRRKITTDDDINPILREMEMQGTKDLVIFTQDMDSGVASMLVDLHKSKRFNILIIKAPTLWRDFVYEDFALCTGATVIEDATGKTFKNMDISVLGTCDKIIVDEDETIIIGTKDISTHIAHLQGKGDEDSNRRLSWLTNKTAILRLGANSETDLSYKRLKTADGIRSSQLALKYGVVKGGGLCLKEVAEKIGEPIYIISQDAISEQDVKKLSKDIKSGNPILVANISDIKQIDLNPAIEIMKIALKEPYRQNMANFGHIVDVPNTIVDASQVVKNAVRNAIGIASTILTSNGYVFIPEPTPQELMINQQQHAF